jgi:Immunoglobulin-like domain of bacterial spore germination/Sporulation and spore germination
VISEQVEGTMRAMGRTVTIALLALCLVAVTGCEGNEAQRSDTVTKTGPPVDGTMRAAVYLLRDGKVAPVSRTIPATLDPERAALGVLLEGPTADEVADGLSTAIPDGTELRGLTLADGVATVDLEGTFDDGGGSASMLGRVAQIVATLTRYGTVERVAFRLDGERVETIGSEGVVVDPPIGRREIEEQTPQVLVESPLPGDGVSSPIRLRGTANVFEATVSLEVRDAADEVILETFTTATSGSGTRGTFATELVLPDAEGPVTIVAFESSAEDGRPLHVFSVPVTLTR